MIKKGSHALESLEDWERFAGPKSAVQWADYRSAKEAARAWLERLDDGAIPSEIEAILVGHSDFSQVRRWSAEPECEVRFDAFGGPANIDVMVHAEDDRGAFVMAVEAKADEPFGEYADRALANALEAKLRSSNSNALARIEGLAARLFEARGKGEPHVREIRYQLMTLSAAALAEAERTAVLRAVAMIQEFDTPRTTEEKRKANGRDLVRFLDRLGVESPGRVLEGELVGPVALEGADGPHLYVGKAVRHVRARE